MMYIDGSVYPDLKTPPTTLSSDEERADYIHRVCGLWDFGLPPERETMKLFAKWKRVFDSFPLPASIAYHAFRSLYGWEPVAGFCLETKGERLDALDGRFNDTFLRNV